MYAAIDIGSNSVQLLICDVRQGQLHTKISDLRTTRLGAGDAKQNLSFAAIENTSAAIADFMQRVEMAGVKNCRLLATAAVREAKNSALLQEAIAEAAPTAPKMEILSGKEEASLAYKGAHASGLLTDSWPVLDVGGSSSELIFPINGDISSVSIEVGAVRARQNQYSVAQIEQLIQSAFPAAYQAPTLLGIGGTITTAAGLLCGLSAYNRDHIEGLSLSFSTLSAMLDELAGLSVEARRASSPLLEKRGEIIVEGLQIWLAAMTALSAEQVVVTGGGILDGAVLEMAAQA